MKLPISLLKLRKAFDLSIFRLDLARFRALFSSATSISHKEYPGKSLRNSWTNPSFAPLENGLAIGLAIGLTVVWEFPVTGWSQEVSQASLGEKTKKDSGQVRDRESFAEGLDSIRKKHNLPGLIAGQFDTKDYLQIEAVGTCRSGFKTPLLVEHPMHLGSCTKSMTATLIGIAIEEGLLRWDSTLGEIFSVDSKVTRSDWHAITVEQLMHHTSGAPANPPWNQFADPSIDLRSHRRNVLHWWMEQPREEFKNNRFLYSNLGYMVLGHILEELRKTSWEEEIQTRLFDPLEMKVVGFGAPSKSMRDKSLPWGHRRVLGLLVANEEDNVPALGPAGTVYSSMEDWVRYLRFHLRKTPAAGAGNPISISQQNFDRLHEPSESGDYAGGWIVIDRTWSSGKIYTHNGSNTSWYAVVFLAPAEGRGIFAASNFGLDAAGPCDEALQWMLKHLPFPKP